MPLIPPYDDMLTWLKDWVILTALFCVLQSTLPASLKVQHYKYVTKDDYRKSSYYVEMEATDATNSPNVKAHKLYTEIQLE